MRKEKALVSVLRGLADLLAEEAAHNPKFADRLASLLVDAKEPRSKPPKGNNSLPLEPLPDIHAEWTARGEPEFRLWLKDQPLQVLRAIIRREDLDSTRRTAKWSEQEKLAAFIADGLSGRLSRGSAFIRGRSGDA
jgi:hypothetical protein